MADLNDHNGNGWEQGTVAPPSTIRQDRLLDAARGYFSDDFNNSSRLDCPPEGAFEALVRKGELPSEEMRKHLFGCSECFREFRGAVESRRQTAASANISSWREWLRRSGLMSGPAYGLLTALVLVTATIFLVLRGREGEGVNVADSGVPMTASISEVAPSTSNQPPQPAHAAPTEVAEATPARTAVVAAAVKGRRARRPTSALSAVLIDLASYSLLRADESPSESSGDRTLKAGVNRLRILLLKDSPPGTYQVAVVDAFGNPLTAERSAKSAGNKIEVNIDTRGLAGRRCRLRISHGGDAPDYYPINVTGR